MCAPKFCGVLACWGGSPYSWLLMFPGRGVSIHFHWLALQTILHPLLLLFRPLLSTGNGRSDGGSLLMLVTIYQQLGCYSSKTINALSPNSLSCTTCIRMNKKVQGLTLASSFHAKALLTLLFEREAGYPSFSIGFQHTLLTATGFTRQPVFHAKVAKEILGG